MIKNYTSGVPVDRTISRIESILVEGGASNITKDYKNGELDALLFMVRMPDTGKEISVRLPAKADAVYDTLRGKMKRPRAGTKDTGSRC